MFTKCDYPILYSSMCVLFSKSFLHPPKAQTIEYRKGLFAVQIRVRSHKEKLMALRTSVLIHTWGIKVISPFLRKITQKNPCHNIFRINKILPVYHDAGKNVWRSLYRHNCDIKMDFMIIRTMDYYGKIDAHAYGKSLMKNYRDVLREIYVSQNHWSPYNTSF